MGSTQAKSAAADAKRSGSLGPFYRFHARIYDQTRWAFLFGRKAAVEWLNLRPGRSVLEIGCGTGLNFPLLVSGVGDSGRVVGVDASMDMLRRAGRRIERQAWPNVRVLCAEAATLELKQRFDAVLFGYSLTMIPGWEQALDRAAALLRPEGVLGVLDFGAFGGWPWPLGSLIRTWLGFNHVHTLRPIEQKMRDTLDNVRFHRKLGGYYVLAAGRRRL